MKTHTNRTITAALALSLSMTLAACGGADEEGAGVTPQATTIEQTSAATTSDDDADDTSDDDADDTSDDAGTGATDPTAAGLAAIATAEGENGGTAFELDDQDDDGTWEVTVREGDRAVEMTVSSDGSTVESSEEDDLDDEDRAALDAATVTLAEAIDIAVAEAGGVLDDAELDEDDDTYRWSVTVDGTTDNDDDEVDVYVDLTTGEVLSVD